MKKLRIALVGCGRISYKHIQAIANNHTEIELVSVCDVIKQRAEEKSDYYLILTGGPAPKVYTDYKAMLDQEVIDIISIATESGYHAEQSIYCMEKKKHVIVEKPMALSTVDADRMIRSAEKNGVLLTVCHQNRFNPPIQKLRQAIENGRFGKLIAGNARVLWNRGKEYYDQAPWRGTYELDGGCLMNQCIHNIDLLQWMLGGEVEQVNGMLGNYIHSYIEAEDYGSIQMKFKNGAIGNVEGTVCVYPTNLEETLTIIGEKGTVSIGGLAVNKIEVWRFSDGLDSENEVIAQCNKDIENVYGNGHTPLYKSFIESVINHSKPYIDGNEGKKAVEIILAAYLSSQNVCRINMPFPKISPQWTISTKKDYDQVNNKMTYRRWRNEYKRKNSE